MPKEPLKIMTSAPSPATKSFWNLGGLTSWQFGRAVFEQMIANNVFGRAAELAFYFLFALFRLIFFMMTLFGLFASYSVELQNNLLSYFADFLPPAAFQLLRRVAIEIAAHASHGKLTFGVVSALWCVSSSLCSMISALNAAHHVREARSCLKVRAIALGLSLLISILLVTALFMVPVGSRFVGWLGAGLRLPPLVVPVWRAMQWPAAIFFVALSCSLVYYYGPDLRERSLGQLDDNGFQLTPSGPCVKIVECAKLVRKCPSIPATPTSRLGLSPSCTPQVHSSLASPFPGLPTTSSPVLFPLSA